MRKEETDIRQLFGSLQFKEPQDFLAYGQEILDKKQSRYGKTNLLEDWLDDNAGVAALGLKTRTVLKSTRAIFFTSVAPGQFTR